MVITGASDAPIPGTEVWLHDLKATRLNGRRAWVVSNAASNNTDTDAGSRCAVQLTDSSIVAVRLSNLTLSPPFPLPLGNLFCIKEAPEAGGLGVYATHDIPAGEDSTSHMQSMLRGHCASAKLKLFMMCGCECGPIFRVFASIIFFQRVWS